MRDEALAHAERLVAELERQKAELQGSPGGLSSDKLSAGMAALDQALAAARRLRATLKAHSDSSQGPG